MNLTDKTFVFLGSSVTYGGDNYSMCEYLADTTGASVVKWAVSGTTLSDARPNSYVKRMLDAIGAQDVCDHFIVQLSTNDAGKADVVLGEVSDSVDPADFDVKTTVGAMEFIIATARARWGCPISFYTGTYMKNQRYADMVDKLFTLREKWGIGIIDLWNDPDMRAVSAEDYARFMKDPVHPTREGYDLWWGPKFAAYLAL